MIRREYPDQPLPSLWGNRQRKSDVSRDQHTTVRRHRASGPHAPDPPARTALRTNEEAVHPRGARAGVCARLVLAGPHCEYSPALALADRMIAHHTREAFEMLPSGTLHDSMRCDNLQAAAAPAPAPDAAPNTARLAGLGCATDRGRLDTLSSKPRARALTSRNFACASVAEGP